MLSNDNKLKGVNEIYYKQEPNINNNTLVLDADFYEGGFTLREYNLAFTQVNDIVYFSTMKKTYQFSIRSDNLIAMNVIERPLPTDNVSKQIICGDNIFLRSSENSVLIVDRYTLQEKNIVIFTTPLKLQSITSSYDGRIVYGLATYDDPLAVGLLEIYADGTYFTGYTIINAMRNESTLAYKIVSNEYGLIFYYQSTIPPEQHYLHYIRYDATLIENHEINDIPFNLHYHNDYLCAAYEHSIDIYKVTSHELILIKTFQNMEQNNQLFVNNFGMFQDYFELDSGLRNKFSVYNIENDTLVNYGSESNTLYGVNLITADGTVYVCSCNINNYNILYLRMLNGSKNILLTEKTITGLTVYIVRTFMNSTGKIFVMYFSFDEGSEKYELRVAELYDIGNYAPDLFYINDNCAQNNLSVNSLSVRSNETNVKISGIDDKLDISGPCNIPSILVGSITTGNMRTELIDLSVDCPIILGEWSIYSTNNNLYFKFGDDFFVYLNWLGNGGQLNKTISHYTIAEDDISLYQIGKPIYSSGHVYSCKLIKKDDNILQQLELSKTTNPTFIKLQNEKEILGNEVNTLQEDNQILLNKYLQGELVIKDDMDEEMKNEIKNNLILVLNIKKQIHEKTKKDKCYKSTNVIRQY